MTFGQSLIAALIIGTSIFFSPSAFSQDVDMEQALKALDDAFPGTLIHNPYDLQWNANGPNKKIKIVNAEGTPTGKALSTKITKRANQPLGYSRDD